MTNPHTPTKAGEAASELLPCPFCGSTKLNTEDCRDFISCANCGNEGPIRMGQGSTASIEAWNRRAPSPADRAASVGAVSESVISPESKLFMLDKLARGRGFRNAAEALASLPRIGMEPAWMAAFDEARDAILNDRGPLEAQGLTNDQTNSVLAILDVQFMPYLKRAALSTPQVLPTPQAERSDTERLDWLERRSHRGAGDGMNPRAVRMDFFHAWPGMHATTLPLPTIREAIDAAMRTTAADTSEGAKS